MQRRKYLATISATVSGVALAGCSGDGGDGSDGSSETEESSGDGGSSETEESSEDGSSNDEIEFREVGETFTVGEGDRVIEYTVDTIVGVESLGGEYTTEEPDGIFAVVEMTIENKTDESFSISTNNYSIITENENTFEPSTDTLIAFDSDERFDTESILYEQLNPSLSTEGAVIFDIPPKTPFVFRIEPAGFLDTSEPEFVSPGGG